MMFGNERLYFPTDWIQGGVFYTLITSEEIISKEHITFPYCVYGDSSGYIMGVGTGTAIISWAWAMTDKEEELKENKYWTDWISLGNLNLFENKVSYLEVPTKYLVFVRFKLILTGFSGKIVYLNKRPSGGYKVFLE
ncbi:MAG: hypothetical protein QXI58_01485 [Candidatus Micrarchaeia archaeon]